MFNTDLTALKNTNSKTGEYLDEEYVYDLTLVAEIRRRLLAIRSEPPIGPVILARRSGGLPFTKDGWRHAWNRNSDTARIPSNMWSMDLRTGAITAADESGADLVEARNFAQRTDAKMTGRYLRRRSESANEVISQRQAAPRK
jgi:hypothetical protein